MTKLELFSPIRPMRRKDDGKRTSRVRGRIAAAVRRMSWAYLLVLLCLWIFLRVEGDRWWLGTLMLFGPLWVTCIPLVVLAPAAMVYRPRSLGVLSGSGGVVAFLILGVCVPWRTPFKRRGFLTPVRLLTCNVHGKSALNKLIAGNDADIVALQEWPGSHERPLLGIGPWHVRQNGELLLVSRFPIVKEEVITPRITSNWGGSAIEYTLSTPDGPIRLFNIHLASPHRPFDAVMAGKSGSTDRLEEYLAVRSEQSRLLSQLAADAGPRVVLCGDFNTPCEGRVYHQFWSTFNDAFTDSGWGLGRSYYAHGAAVRIDHVLVGSSWTARDCWVGPAVGSPHRPVVAELELGGD